MLSTLRAEFRKLYTIRSTYFIAAFGIVLAGFIAFYVEGLRGADSLFDATKVQGLMLNTANLLSVFGALVAILLITHEYRFNTIMYTLTASNSRTKVLLAKLVAVIAHAILYTIVGVALAVFLMYVGLGLKDMTLYAHQYIDWGDVLWRSFFLTVSYSALGLVLGLLFRNVVGAIVTLFMTPATLEPLLGLLLKDNVKYLPFHASDQVANPTTTTSLTHGEAALLFTGYIVVAYIVAWILFVRRDAN